MRAGWPNAFESIASSFCAFVNSSVFVRPILLNRNITINVSWYPNYLRVILQIIESTQAHDTQRSTPTGRDRPQVTVPTDRVPEAGDSAEKKYFMLSKLFAGLKIIQNTPVDDIQWGVDSNAKSPSDYL